MCGIGGIVFSDPRTTDCLHKICVAIGRKLTHRGPDDQGQWSDPLGFASFVQTRLSIIDLSEAGHQPMETPDGRYVLVFNGEIYNYRELRQELAASGVEFVGNSDSEVLLYLLARKGMECLNRLSGMFAFAIWDRVEKSLYLARDPLGIKPLYYWEKGDRLAFASEIRAVLDSDLGPRRLDATALHGYFRSGSVQEPLTLVEGVRMVPPGHFIKWHRGNLAIHSYWGLCFTEEITDPITATQTSQKVLEEAVERHFVSDVPVGIFLSGGLDSTALVAVGSRHGRRNIHTFCIGFDDPNYDESHIARKTAEHFGCHHHEKQVNLEDAHATLEEYLLAVDQPSIDGFNTFVVSKFAKECGIKVVLSGIGSDELLGSYPSFQLVPKLLAWHRRSSKVGAGYFLAKSGALIRGYSPQAKTLRFLATKGKFNDAYDTIRSAFSSFDATTLVSWYTDGQINLKDAEDRILGSELEHMGNAISQKELSSYMLNQLLRDADVMSMHHSMELRVPFLDRHWVEHLTRIAPSIRLSQNKRLLVDSVPEIPEWVRNRPKQGFIFPFATWMEEHWSRGFSKLKRAAPIPLPKWYHRWLLFSVDSFLEKNRIEGCVTH